MLVLSRKPNQTIQIGDDVTVTIVRTGRNTVQIGVDAPADCFIVRGEIAEQLTQASAAKLSPSTPKRANLTLPCLGSIS